MASMKGGGRLYLAGAVMLLALTHGMNWPRYVRQDFR